MVRCKACGLIMKDNDTFDTCPACGVPKTAFEPYRDPVKPPRRRLLNLHLHPIVVHFPQSFSVVVPALAIASAVFPDPWAGECYGAARMLMLLMPPAVLASMATGIFDGRVRFKKARRTFLVRKMIVSGTVVLTVSCAMALAAALQVPAFWLRIAAVAGGAACAAGQVYLAGIGARLMYAELPG